MFPLKYSDVYLAFAFMLLTAIMLMGAEWLVWVAFVPLIIFAICGSLRGVFFAGSIVVLLVGYLAIGWLKLYNTRTLVFGLTSFYIFFGLFILSTRFLSGKEILRLCRARDIVTENDEAEYGQKRQILIALVPPTIWYFIAKLASYTTVGSSWTDMAMFQPMMAPLIWILGARGITFIVLLANSLIAAWLLRRSKEIFMAGLGLLIIVGSCYSFSRFSSPEGYILKVALLQGNFPQSWEWRHKHADTDILDTYLKMMKEAAENKPDIIVWPEYAIPDDVFRKDHLLEKIMTAVNDSESHLVFGTMRELGGIIEGFKKRHNVAVILSPEDAHNTPQQYVSVRPVPFEVWVTPGNKLHNITLDNHRIGILLCYEETLPTISAELSNQSTELLLSLANNSRFKKTRGIYLASLQSRLRAAETGKYVARATNTGVTQVVNPYGRIIAKARTFNREILTTEVRLSKKGPTFYSRYGDWPMMMGITAVWLIALFSMYRRAG